MAEIRTQGLQTEVHTALRVVGRSLRQVSDSINQQDLCLDEKLRGAERNLDRAERTWRRMTRWIRENPDKLLANLKARGLSNPEERLAAILRSCQCPVEE